MKEKPKLFKDDLKCLVCGKEYCLFLLPSVYCSVDCMAHGEYSNMADKELTKAIIKPTDKESDQ